MKSHILSSKKDNKRNVNFHIKNMAITSIFLSLAILTSFGTNFIKISFLGDFLSLDISLVFIIPLIFICSYYWSILASTILSLFTFLWPGNIWIGVVFNLIANFTFVTLVWLFTKAFNKKIIANNSISLFINFSLSILISSIFFSFLNGILFQPLWWWFFKLTDTIFFVEVANKYNFGLIPHAFLLWIPDYWSGIFGLYISFNIFKFAIVSFITFIAITFISKSNLIEHFFNKKDITY